MDKYKEWLLQMKASLQNPNDLILGYLICRGVRLRLTLFEDEAYHPVGRDQQRVIRWIGPDVPWPERSRRLYGRAVENDR